MTSDARPKPLPLFWHPHTQILVLIGIGVTILFVIAMLSSTDGHFIPQVVDLYLTCQYAQAMADGHPFVYNVGEAPSTGATSFLHTVLLAVAHKLGCRGEGLLAFAIFSGAVCYIFSIALARRIAVVLAGPREGFLAGLLLALGGPIVWGFLYGADVALTMMLALFLLDRLLCEWHLPSVRGGVIIATLLALARPEGLPIALLLGVAWWRRHSLEGPRNRGWTFLIPSAAGVALLVLNLILTGSLLGSSVAEKSLFANYGLFDALALSSEYLIDVVRGLLLGFFPSQVSIGFSRGWATLFFPPLALIFILLAAATVQRALAWPVRIWLGIVALLYIVYTPNMYMGTHFNRYLMWAFPTLLTLTAVGIGTLARLIARRSQLLDRSVFVSIALICATLGALATVRFAALYAEQAGGIYQRDYAAAVWIQQNLPHGVAMANVATSVEYLTGHRNTNLHGVTSPAFFGNRSAERDAGVFEAWARVPEAERPLYLISSVSAQESYPTLQELASEPPLFQTHSLADDILILRMHYDAVGKNRRPYSPDTLATIGRLTLVDQLNICDNRDEREHAYRWRSRLGNWTLNGTARSDNYSAMDGRGEAVIDAGRAILGSESFQIRAHPGRELVMVMRTSSKISARIMTQSGSREHAIEFPECGFTLRIGNQVAQKILYRPHPGWNEQVVRLEAGLVATPTLQLTLTGRYPSFYYWFYQ
ncbi:MAG: hypothetical protein MUF51_02255 [Vicinamibacteria bacterium]|jgi:hypothetical protein|nr:hypothetical protein [Vicinamibacteria bacterium]